MNTTKYPAAQVTRNNDLLDTVMEEQERRNDAALSRFLEVAPPVISKIRGGLLPIGDRMLIRIHEKTGMPFSRIRLFVPLRPA